MLMPDARREPPAQAQPGAPSRAPLAVGHAVALRGRRPGPGPASAWPRALHGDLRHGSVAAFGQCRAASRNGVSRSGPADDRCSLRASWACGMSSRRPASRGRAHTPERLAGGRLQRPATLGRHLLRGACQCDAGAGRLCDPGRARAPAGAVPRLRGQSVDAPVDAPSRRRCAGCCAPSRCGTEGSTAPTCCGPSSLLQRAVQLNPDATRAWSGIGFMTYTAYCQGWGPEREDVQHSVEAAVGPSGAPGPGRQLHLSVQGHRHGTACRVDPPARPHAGVDTTPSPPECLRRARGRAAGAW